MSSFLEVVQKRLANLASALCELHSTSGAVQRVVEVVISIENGRRRLSKFICLLFSTRFDRVRSVSVCRSRPYRMHCSFEPVYDLAVAERYHNQSEAKGAR